jgi:thiamine-phosphate pyrophosphorylase
VTLREKLRLYLVTDPLLAGERGVMEIVRQALESGFGTIQLRDKTASTSFLTEMAVRLKALTEEHDALFLVNDRVDVARASGAHGVHLGQDDMPPEEARSLLGANAVIGVSVRTAAEARAAEAAGADYIAANLVYPTDTKKDISAPLGIDGIRLLRKVSSLPLIAIGGINRANASDTVAAGADGIAVVSAIMAAENVPHACRDLLEAIGKVR